MMHAKGIRRAPVLCTAGVCALAALAVAGTAGGSGADAASRPSSPDSGRARSGMVTVAGLAMVSRPSPACAAPACVPRPGREADGAPGGGWGALVDAEGSLFAAVPLPPGARITRLVLRGFDGLPRNFGPHLGRAFARYGPRDRTRPPSASSAPRAGVALRR